MADVINGTSPLYPGLQFDDMNFHSLFPTPIGFVDIDRSLSDQELLFICELETRANTGNTTSVDNFVLRNATLASLRLFIENSVSEYFKSTVSPKHDVELKITQSWFNYSKHGQYHHKHAHPNSFISGVFYVQTNPDDRIYFYKDQYQQIKFPTNNWNAYNSDSWWFEACVGRLILFPSHLTHMVPVVQGEKTRISLSFNTFPVGAVGEEIDLTLVAIE